VGSCCTVGGARWASEDSDLDLMVLLEGPLRLGRDLETIVQALYRCSWRSTG